jgi:hypothetical protein
MLLVPFVALQLPVASWPCHAAKAVLSNCMPQHEQPRSRMHHPRVAVPGFVLSPGLSRLGPRLQGETKKCFETTLLHCWGLC